MRTLFFALLIIQSVNILAAENPASKNPDAKKLAKTNNGVVGYWSSESSIFEITVAGEKLEGHVLALLNPTYLADEETGREGEVRTDDQNPDVELRSRPILGLSMFSDYQFKDNLWQGKIYDPESGNTYQSRMKVNRKGELEIRGYIGMPMFGRTAKFSPISRCTENITKMLLQLELASPCAVQQ